MNVAIRYQSRGCHVKSIAESLAEGAEVEAISIDDPRAPIKKHVDLLFIGGALYNFHLDPKLVEYIESIPEGKVRQALVFGSSALTRRPIYSIQELLKKKGIDINPMALYMRGKPKPYLFEITPPFARREIKKLQKQIEEGTYGNEVEQTPVMQLIRAQEEKKKKQVEAELKGTAADVAEAAAEEAAKVAEAAAERAAKVAEEAQAVAAEAAQRAAEAAREAEDAAREAEAAQKVADDAKAQVKADIDEAKQVAKEAAVAAQSKRRK